MSTDGINQANQYLSFKLGKEEFALDISKVREVLDFTDITTVPQTPAYMMGVINLRGSVVPVVDLNRKFSIKETLKTVNTRIIICEVDFECERVILGVLADSVHEVMEIPPANIEPAPRIGTQLDTSFLKGMGKRDDEFIMILDIDTVFSGEALSFVTASDTSGMGPEEIQAA